MGYFNLCKSVDVHVVILSNFKKMCVNIICESDQSCYFLVS